MRFSMDSRRWVFGASLVSITVQKSYLNIKHENLSLFRFCWLFDLLIKGLKAPLPSLNGLFKEGIWVFKRVLIYKPQSQCLPFNIILIFVLKY